MLLAQGKHWSATLAKGAQGVALALLREALPEDLIELRGFRIELPVTRWNGVVKHVLSDRKLLGGILLDFANQKDQVATAVGNDRLLAELQRVVLDATAALVEAEVLVLAPVAAEGQ